MIAVSYTWWIIIFQSMLITIVFSFLRTSTIRSTTRTFSPSLSTLFYSAVLTGPGSTAVLGMTTGKSTPPSKSDHVLHHRPHVEHVEGDDVSETFPSPHYSQKPSSYVIPPHEKTIYFVRHGITEMNERLEVVNWHHPDFKDGEIYDTRLSSNGIAQAIAKHEDWITAKGTKPQEIDFTDVEVIIASPLSRTMETAQYLFYHKEKLLGDHIPKIVHPLVRERLFMSSDIGRLKHELIVDFPDWSLDHVPHDSHWWYKHDPDEHGEYEEWRPVERIYVSEGEPESHFLQRMRELKEWLLQRPEKKMIVVAHWGTIRALTGLAFKNCEIAKVQGDQLLEDPIPS